VQRYRKCACFYPLAEGAAFLNIVLSTSNDQLHPCISIKLACLSSRLSAGVSMQRGSSNVIPSQFNTVTCKNRRLFMLKLLRASISGRTYFWNRKNVQGQLMSSSGAHSRLFSTFDSRSLGGRGLPLTNPATVETLSQKTTSAVKSSHLFSNSRPGKGESRPESV
jgi:hypothetical protein